MLNLLSFFIGLFQYFFSVLIIFCLEIAAGIIAYIYRNKVSIFINSLTALILSVKLGFLFLSCHKWLKLLFFTIGQIEEIIEEDLRTGLKDTKRRIAWDTVQEKVSLKLIRKTIYIYRYSYMYVVWLWYLRGFFYLKSGKTLYTKKNFDCPLPFNMSFTKNQNNSGICMAVYTATVYRKKFAPVLF